MENHELSTQRRMVNETIMENNILKSWCTNQLAYWFAHGMVYHKTMEAYDTMNTARDSFFIFHFNAGSVTISDKPDITGEEILSKIHGNTNNLSHYRAALYHRLFSHVAREYLPHEKGCLGMDMHDVFPTIPGIPVFCFQKKREEHTILLPDIDFVGPCYYYTDPVFNDPIPYGEKLIKAVFVGSTTGRIHTRQSVAELANQRLRAGVHFRNDPDIDFHLPNIVQCDSPETEALIRELGFGDGGRLTWEDQFRYRFLLSMDGNGATCSRVALALKSNGVLLKYKSPYSLYYFSSLIPWLHYIPIEKHKDVNRVIAMEKRNPGYFEYIAEAGADFYRKFLTFEPIAKYTAKLLGLYFSCFRT